MEAQLERAHGGNISDSREGCATRNTTNTYCWAMFRKTHDVVLRLAGKKLHQAATMTHLEEGFRKVVDRVQQLWRDSDVRGPQFDLHTNKAGGSVQHADVASQVHTYGMA